ncbi:AAA family ATPase [Patescibacteria group bacterium]
MADQKKPVLRYDRGAYSVRVDSEGFGPKTKALTDHLKSRVIGQDRAADRLARSFSVHNAGLQEPNKPIIAALFAGPTGIGKTLMAQELARHLIVDKPEETPPLFRIQCAQFRERHQVSQLLGSPPGYIGSDDIPGLSQQKLDQPDFFVKYRDFVEGRFKDHPEPEDMNAFLAQCYERLGPFKSVILFDEIEKAHPALHDILLHVIDDGEVKLSNGEVTSFRGSAIILTCNVGGKRSQQILSGQNQGIGFGGTDSAEASDDEVDQQIYGETLKLIEKTFKPELVGRIRNEIVVFRALKRHHCRKVLDIMLGEVLRLVSGSMTSRSIPLQVQFTDAFKEYVLDKGVDPVYGLRPLKQAVYKLVKLVLANAIESGHLHAGDEVLFAHEDGKPCMFRKDRPEPAEEDIEVLDLLDSVGPEDDGS